jgi:hypothetical protein
VTDDRAAAVREVPLATVTPLPSRPRVRGVEDVGLATVTPISGRSLATVVPLRGDRGPDRSRSVRQGTVSRGTAHRSPGPRVTPWVPRLVEP